ncbi:MAG: hypothetical protein IKT44_00775 [Clostridia bacterium]|nr:hypothetical protein [Clostridia bacterium]
MKELFLIDLSILSVLSLLLIILWFILVILKKHQKTHVWIFAVSHHLLYLEVFLLNEKNPSLVGCIILILTFFILIFNALKKGLIEKRLNFIYWVYSILLLLILLAILALSNIDFSFLALR